jgi:hypothetical protein
MSPLWPGAWGGSAKNQRTRNEEFCIFPEKEISEFFAMSAERDNSTTESDGSGIRAG